MTKSYLFYDIETTGLSKAFDQVLQFAAIRTDRGLNEIDRHTVSVKLRPDVVPSPAAMLTNRISVPEFSKGLCEYEAVAQIHRLMNQPGTTSIGYNTMGFDDEFMRFSFHRNLLPPYTHQYKNGCSRMDLFPIAVIYQLYKKEVLVWPEIDGKLSLKLEHLNTANRLVAGQSHDAVVDVAATIELARRFIKKKKIWRYLEGYFDKETDAHRLKDLPVAMQSGAGQHGLGLMVSGEYGPDQNYQIPVISIGRSIPYPNQTLWLRLDLPQLRDVTPESIDENTWVVRKRMGEPGILLPPHDRYWKKITSKRAGVVDENLKWLKENHDIFQTIVEYYREYRYPFIPNLDPDASLYQIGFYSRADELLCRKFHRASLENKIDLIDQFSSPDARALCLRVICRNYPAALPAKLAAEFQNYMDRVQAAREADAIVDYREKPRLTPIEALNEIKHLKKSGDLIDHQSTLLVDLENYLRTTFKIRDTD
ncbi:MAG: exonuclease domain-containing protein [Desulfobacterales bacterium]|jgi:exodeoxyribonuclease-1